ncbi:cystatin-C-like [Salarias fasciatus]|uniref:cystatin-C-like n=1 Tax=Salarias fasciatus TaxID=181472 RepID=UPI0011768555|nr:cystatin-C-like [Salarias fasciatus]
MFVWLCVFLCAWGTGGSARAPGGLLLGGPRRVPVDGAPVVSAARFAVAQFNKVNEEERFAYKLMNITSAKMQVVAGVNYFLDALLGRTVCGRRSAADAQRCALHPEPKECQCLFVVTDIPWEHSRVLTQNKCHLNKK